MKLVLASAPSCAGKAIIKKISELVGKRASEISVAIINEAYAVESGDKRWLIDELGYISRKFGGEIDFVNLLALDIKEIQARLDKADIVWCLGGSTDYLKSVIDKSGLSKLLPKLIETKVWVGSSAGSSVLGVRGSYKSNSVIYQGEVHEKQPLKYFEIVDSCIFPHIGGEFVPKNAFEICITESKENKYPVYALSDKSAIIVDGNKIYMIGKNSHKLENGEVTDKV